MAWREGGREGGEEYHINGCYDHDNGYTQAILRPYTYYNTHIQCHTTYLKSRQVFKVDKNVAPQVPLKYAILGLTSLP